MKLNTKIPFILGLIVTIAIFSATWAQSPTTDIIRILGQLLPAAFIGAIVFVIGCAIGFILIRIRR